MKKIKSGTGRYRVERWCGGVTAGLHGIVCFERLSDTGERGMYGLNPEELLGRELGEGAVIELAVRVVREGRIKHNPWVRADGKPNYRATRAGRVTARSCHACHPPRKRKGFRASA